MELELANQILELEPIKLDMLLTSLRMKDRDAYELLRELVEDQMFG